MPDRGEAWRWILRSWPWALPLLLVVVVGFVIYKPAGNCLGDQQSLAGLPSGTRLEKAVAEPGNATIEATLLVPSFLSVLNQCTGGLPAVSLDLPAWLRNVAAGDAIPVGVIARTHLGSDSGGTMRLDLTASQPIAAGAASIVPVRLGSAEITQAGKYSGDFVLVPGTEGSPMITVTALVQDLFVWPLLGLVAGAWLAWGLLRRADQERPKELLRAQLRTAGETYKRFRADKPGCPYQLGGAFPIGDSWKASTSSDFAAERLLFEIDRARTQIELDLVNDKVADLAELVGLLPKLCAQREELVVHAGGLAAAESEVLRHHPDLRLRLQPQPPSPIQRATSVMLAVRPELLTADDAAAFLTGLRQQADAVDTWLQAWRYLDTVLTSWQATRQLPPADRLELDRLAAPGAVATVDLWPADDWDKIRKAGVREKLAAIHLAAESALQRSKGLSIPAPADLGAPIALAGRRTERRTGPQIIAAVEARDRLEFVITFLATAFAYLLVLYVGKNFGGSPWDYISAFVAGAAGQLVVNWKLLPWYRSYTPARTSAT